MRKIISLLSLLLALTILVTSLTACGTISAWEVKNNLEAFYGNEISLVNGDGDKWKTTLSTAYNISFREKIVKVISGSFDNSSDVVVVIQFGCTSDAKKVERKLSGKTDDYIKRHGATVVISNSSDICDRAFTSYNELDSYSN